MNCEQVEELLSAYLDNVLAPEERRVVAAHLQTCRICSEALADYRRNDALLSQLPRVSPDEALRERLFSSLEYLELTGTEQQFDASAARTVPRLPASSPRRDTPGRPHLVAIPGGRSTAPNPTVKIEQSPGRRRRGPRIAMAVIAAMLVVAVGIGALLEVSGKLNPDSTRYNVPITPPLSGPQANGPLSAGVRFIFLRDGALWSEPGDGSSTQADRLTPDSVTVAPQWVVSDTPPGRAAGDLVAYIDLQKARVHIIRSDGQEDTVVNQPLTKGGVPSDSDTWAIILSSLVWSPDGSQLAFVGDPDGTGQTHLYLYSRMSGAVTQIPVSVPGSVSNLTWSPDGARVAFEVSQKSITSILDYNVQNLGTLIIAHGIGSHATAGQSVLALDWSPSSEPPTITWSVGSIGQVRSLWMYRIGIDSGNGEQLHAGNYAQAIYSRQGHGIGSWLVITSIAGRSGDIERLDVTPGANLIQLTSGRQVNFAEWSPDGASIGYLDAVSEGVGTFHIVNTSTAVDFTIADGVTYDPAPAWSLNSKQVAFSTGTRIGIASTQPGSSPNYLKLEGAASALTWSVVASQQLIVAMDDVQPGIYLVDTEQGKSTLADKSGADRPIVWTVIP